MAFFNYSMGTKVARDHCTFILYKDGALLIFVGIIEQFRMPISIFEFH